MPEVLLYPATWSNPEWRRDFNRLSADQKYVITDSLNRLHSALQECSHPISDPNLQEWEPAKFTINRTQAGWGGEWVKYRLSDRDNRGRVIAVYFCDDDRIYLVDKTITHDTQHLRRAAEKFKVPKK